MSYLPEIILANLFLILIWISYELFLSRTRIFQANRFFLLGGSVFAVVLPWLPWQISFHSPTGQILGLPGFTVAGPAADPLLTVGSSVSAPPADPAHLIEIIYVSVVILLLLVSAGQLIRLLMWTKTRPILRWENHRVIVLDKPWSAFSFFRTIYFPEPFEPDTKETRTILLHEKVHASQLHSFDNLVILIIRILFFYNPAIHLISKKLRLTHEYLADEVSAGFNRADYSQTLISHQFLVPRLILMQSFNSKSFLKRRLIMLSKTKNTRQAGWKYLMAAPLLAGMILLSGWTASAQDQAKKSREEIAKMAVEKELTKAGFSKADIAEIKMRIDAVNPAEVNVSKIPPSKKAADPAGIKNEKKISGQVFTEVEDMPSFQGGDIGDFRNWVQRNVKYPPIAMENKISGTVYATFVVSSVGEVKDVEILRSADVSLDHEVMKVIRTSPKWKPGSQRGTPVNVSFTVPVKFSLN